MKHTISGYHFKTTLGSGGMASVYLATQTSLDRSVAVKILKPCNETEDQKKILNQQFQQESKLIAQLNHPNIIQIIDKGLTEQGAPYFVMPYVKCVSLKTVLQRDDVSLTRKLDILIQVCSALSYAHRNHVIHRDIKPANILVDYDGHVRIVDFGIAGIYQKSIDAQPRTENTNTDANTLPSVVMGTDAYMAPEQRENSLNTTTLSDIFSLGVLMHEVFLGCLPNSSTEKIKAPESDCNNIIPHLRPTIEKCLETLPTNRPESIEKIRQALLLVAQGKHLRGNHWALDAKRDKLSSHYALLDVIKENPFGATYLVNDANKQRLLVIKKQNLEQVGNAVFCASKLTHLRHPNIANIYGTGKNSRVFIAVNEYVAAGNLQDRLNHSFTLLEWTSLAFQICSALAFAHTSGVTHGNLRPSNILFTDNYHIKLCDFGFPNHSYGMESDWYHPLNESASPLTDIYSAGAILFQILTCVPPKKNWWSIQNWWRLRHTPKPLRDTLLKMISNNPKKRILSAELAAAKFNELQENQETQILIQKTS